MSSIITMAAFGICVGFFLVYPGSPGSPGSGINKEKEKTCSKRVDIPKSSLFRDGGGGFVESNAEDDDCEGESIDVTAAGFGNEIEFGDPCQKTGDKCDIMTDKVGCCPSLICSLGRCIYDEDNSVESEEEAEVEVETVDFEEIDF